MYTQHFGLKEAPFSIAPDPRYLYMSERHQDALAHLLYGLDAGGGFVVLTGEIGAGKTTLCRRLLARVPARLNVAYVLYPKLTVPELLRAICDEFRISLHAGGDLKSAIDALNAFLLTAHAQGRDNVLVIDEAQNLSAEVLEHLRLLTNLETDDTKLLQIVLIGQPELRDMLAQPALAQLAQRVIARYHLDALTREETTRYVRHRLQVAGAPNDALFDDAALARVFRWSRGVPRRVNLLCDRALLAAFVKRRASVGAAEVDLAGSEIFPSEAPQPGRPWPSLVTGSLVLAAAAVVGVTWLRLDAGPMPEAAGPAPAAAPAATAPPAVAAPVPAGAAVAVADPAPPATAALDQLQVPDADSAPGETEQLRDLARRWGIEVRGADPCAALRGDGLWCHRGVMTLAAIRGLDRPGLLSLRDRAGRSVPALLTSLDDGQATLQFDPSLPPQRVTITALAQAWRGEFVTLWRVPPGYAGVLGAGSEGPAVDRLAAQLAATRGEPAPAAGRPLDAALLAQLIAFQVAHDLSADGLAGPTTFMRLNQASGGDGPRLHSPR